MKESRVFQKVLAVVLSVTMVFGSVPLHAFADDGGGAFFVEDLIDYNYENDNQPDYSVMEDDEDYEAIEAELEADVVQLTATNGGDVLLYGTGTTGLPVVRTNSADQAPATDTVVQTIDGSRQNIRLVADVRQSSWAADSQMSVFLELSNGQNVGVATRNNAANNVNRLAVGMSDRVNFVRGHNDGRFGEIGTGLGGIFWSTSSGTAGAIDGYGGFNRTTFNADGTRYIIDVNIMEDGGGRIAVGFGTATPRYEMLPAGTFSAGTYVRAFHVFQITETVTDIDAWGIYEIAPLDNDTGGTDPGDTNPGDNGGGNQTEPGDGVLIAQGSGAKVGTGTGINNATRLVELPSGVTAVQFNANRFVSAQTSNQRFLSYFMTLSNGDVVAFRARSLGTAGHTGFDQLNFGIGGTLANATDGGAAGSTAFSPNSFNAYNTLTSFSPAGNATDANDYVIIVEITGDRVIGALSINGVATASLDFTQTIPAGTTIIGVYAFAHNNNTTIQHTWALYDLAGDDNGSPVDPGTAPTVAPNLTVGVGASGTVALSWGAVPGAAEYVINGGDLVDFVTTELSQTITGLTDGTEYTFTVFARNSYGDGPVATDVATPVDMPLTAIGNAWLETVYAYWTGVAGASYNVYVREVGGAWSWVNNPAAPVVGQATWTNDHSPLARVVNQTTNQWRVDVPGLRANVAHELRIVEVGTGREVVVTGLAPTAFDRQGFAFDPTSPWGITTGAYNADGTLRADAVVIYVTAENVNNLTTPWGTTGIGGDALFHENHARNRAGTNVGAMIDATPVAIRFVGNVPTPATVRSGNMIRVARSANFTFEGVGRDATISGWGLNIMSSNVVVRNLTFIGYPDDAINLEGWGGTTGQWPTAATGLLAPTANTGNRISTNIWITNNTFHDTHNGGGGGDGAVDASNNSSYFTIGWNRVYDGGRLANLGSTQNNIRFRGSVHHNFVSNNDSRVPRVRWGQVHFYNNVIDGANIYAIGAGHHASVIAEGNYFVRANRPMIISNQGASLMGGNNTLTGDYPGYLITSLTTAANHAGNPRGTADIFALAATLVPNAFGAVTNFDPTVDQGLPAVNNTRNAQPFQFFNPGGNTRSANMPVSVMSAEEALVAVSMMAGVAVPRDESYIPEVPGDGGNDIFPDTPTYVIDFSTASDQGNTTPADLVVVSNFPGTTRIVADNAQQPTFDFTTVGNFRTRALSGAQVMDPNGGNRQLLSNVELSGPIRVVITARSTDAQDTSIPLNFGDQSVVLPIAQGAMRTVSYVFESGEGLLSINPWPWSAAGATYPGRLAIQRIAIYEVNDDVVTIQTDYFIAPEIIAVEGIVGDTQINGIWTDGFFTAVGTDNNGRWRAGQGGGVFETGQNGQGYVEFTTTGVSTVTFYASSTGGENHSAATIWDADGNAQVEVNGTLTVFAAGNVGTRFTFENLPAGTWRVVSNGAQYAALNTGSAAAIAGVGRGARIHRITVVQTIGQLPSLDPTHYPTDFAATSGVDAEVPLSWNHVVNATRHEFRYRVEGTTNWSDWAATDLRNSHTVTNLTNGTTYEFQVRGHDGTNASAESAIVTATPTALPILEIAGITANATHDFGSVSYDFTAADFIPLTVTVRNDGTAAAENISITTGSTSFILIGDTTQGSLVPNADMTFQVVPSLVLAAGLHTGVVTISADGLEDITFNVNFNVGAQDMNAVWGEVAYHFNFANLPTDSAQTGAGLLGGVPTNPISERHPSIRTVAPHARVQDFEWLIGGNTALNGFRSNGTAPHNFIDPNGAGRLLGASHSLTAPIRVELDLLTVAPTLSSSWSLYFGDQVVHFPVTGTPTSPTTVVIEFGSGEGVLRTGGVPWGANTAADPVGRVGIQAIRIYEGEFVGPWIESDRGDIAFRNLPYQYNETNLAVQYVEVTNVGTETTTVTAMIGSGFEIVGNQTANLVAGASTTIAVRPVLGLGTGGHTASLVVSADAGGNDLIIPVTVQVSDPVALPTNVNLFYGGLPTSTVNEFPNDVNESVEWAHEFRRISFTEDSHLMRFNGAVRDVDVSLAIPFMLNEVLWVPLDAARAALPNTIWTVDNDGNLTVTAGPVSGIVATSTFEGVALIANEAQHGGNAIFVPLEDVAVALNIGNLGWDERTNTLVVVTGTTVAQGNVLYNNINNRPEAWYGSQNSIAIATNFVYMQRANGGWPRGIGQINAAPHQQDIGGMRPEIVAQIAAGFNLEDSYFGRGITTNETRFLLRMYEATGIERFREAGLRGFDTMIRTQDPIGGWPYQISGGSYHRALSISDRAISYLIWLMMDIENDGLFADTLGDERVAQAIYSGNLGLEWILNTQIRSAGFADGVERLTAWPMAVYQTGVENLPLVAGATRGVTGQPAWQREFEPMSINGNESIDIIRLLMSIENPSEEIREAIHAAVCFFDYIRIDGYRLNHATGLDPLLGRNLVPEEGARPLWPRFIDINNFEPLFYDRTGPFAANVSPHQGVSTAEFITEHGTWQGFVSGFVSGNATSTGTDASAVRAGTRRNLYRDADGNLTTDRSGEFDLVASFHNLSWERRSGFNYINHFAETLPQEYAAWLEREGLVANCPIFVTNIEIDQNDMKLYVGETYALTFTITPDNATNQDVSWTSSDATVVTVDQNGLIAAVGVGVATIRVTTDCGGFYDEIEITVEVEDDNLTVNWEDNDSEFTIGEDEPLVFVINGATVAEFVAVYVGGVRLNDADFNIESGSIRIVLLPTFLNTLAPGRHNMQVYLTNDRMLPTYFTINRAEEVVEEVTVTFIRNHDANDNTVVATRDVETGGTVELPAVNRAGYTFEGWFTARTGGEPFTTTTQVTADMNVYARWQVIQVEDDNEDVEEVTVTFIRNHDANDNTVVANRSTETGETVTLPPAPTRAGHEFLGWFTARVGGTEFTATTVVTADMNVYARWRPTGGGIVACPPGAPGCPPAPGQPGPGQPTPDNNQPGPGNNQPAPGQPGSSLPQTGVTATIIPLISGLVIVGAAVGFIIMKKKSATKDED